MRIIPYVAVTLLAIMSFVACEEMATPTRQPEPPAQPPPELEPPPEPPPVDPPDDPEPDPPTPEPKPDPVPACGPHSASRIVGSWDASGFTAQDDEIYSFHEDGTYQKSWSSTTPSPGLNQPPVTRTVTVNGTYAYVSETCLLTWSPEVANITHFVSWNGSDQFSTKFSAEGANVITTFDRREPPVQQAPEPQPPESPPEPPSEPPPEPPFSIEIVYDTALPANIQDGLNRAVDYWQKAIAADGGPPIATVGDTGKCALPAERSGGITDDLLIVVGMAPMEPDVTTIGGVTIDNTPLGIAYSCAYRANGLQYFGRIEFNDDPHRASSFDRRAYNIARHEIAHLLGFGSSPAWERHVRGGHFHGPQAVRKFGRPVPITAEGHWVSVPGLTWDIMSVPSSVVLEVTLAALDDIGHTVDYSYAEPSPF